MLLLFHKEKCGPSDVGRETSPKVASLSWVG